MSAQTFARRVNRLSRIKQLTSDAAVKADFYLDSSGKIHVNLETKNKITLEGRPELFEDSKTAINRFIKPNYVIDLSLVGLSPDCTGLEFLSETKKTIDKFLSNSNS